MAGPGPGDPDEHYDFLFKLVLVGDASVGKTCVVQRFKTGAFSERQSSTIGVDFTMKTLEIQGKRVKLQIWDTAGQERFRTITQSYYRSANGAILAYDITKRSSFLSVPHWIEDVRKYAGSNIVQLLIASLHNAYLGSPVPALGYYGGHQGLPCTMHLPGSGNHGAVGGLPGARAHILAFPASPHPPPPAGQQQPSFHGPWHP
ncbi:ras-related protein Rab-43 isoform X3 [Artibeus jamaicensis]|uniref:ras-related protein Rab-43 isoform X3 n=1 Tax=Artibeus jamaicensis TaxID=9417 RepID=UPI00235A5B50|nr:ras-related protein Rab-43 isoform X3 [Artibeus jamaicensis]